MKKYKLECAYSISKFKPHKELKARLLDLIAESTSEHVVQPHAEVDITRTDWATSSNFTRPWVEYLKQPLVEHMLDVYKDLGYGGYTLHEIWFQQYQKNSQHGWHTHSANFTNVYYLEMPDDAPKTLIVNAFNQQEIIEVEVEEGDILVFPSFVVHKAPINISNNRKTIISYNVNATYTDDIYGRGLV